MDCRICNNNQNNYELNVREMMFGLRVHFKYVVCGRCGCMQISEYLKDSNQYYPKDYYSIDNDSELGLIRKIKRWRNRNSIQPGLFGFLISRFFPENRYQSIRILSKNKAQSILDVGCGHGEMIQFLNSLGFSNLTGVDPFIEKDIIFNDELRVYKKSIYEINGKYDFIMLHHSFEHMEKPLKVLQTLKSLLQDKGLLLIRIPVAKSFAFDKYRENWVQFDSPRHQYIHSIDSLRLLCEESGLKISNIIFDSMPFQFWASDMYKNDLPLMQRMKPLERVKSFLKFRLFNNYRRLCRRLNDEQRGDQAAFYIQRST